MRDARRRLVTMLAAGSLVASGVACKKKSTALVDSVEAPNIEAPDGGDSIAEPGAEGARQLAFRIDQVFAGQRPSAKPPFHEPGGDWTFFDAKLESGALFTFGFAALGESKSSFAAFGDVLLAAPDSAAGAKLTLALAKTFRGKVPPAKTSPQPLSPQPIKAAFLAVDAQRASGGFSGKNGGNYATKLFLQRKGLEAEVFFNFNLQTKRGEFSEKDSEYADDMVAFVASELRDGPQPVRTPASDPQMTLIGPRIEWTHTLEGLERWGFSPDGDRYWMREGKKIVAYPLTPNGKPTDVLMANEGFGLVKCVPSACAFVDESFERATDQDRQAPKTLVAFDRNSKSYKPLAGPWKNDPLLESIATDGSFAVVGMFEAAPEGKARRIVHWIVPLDGGPARGPLALADKSDVEFIETSPARIVARVGDAWRKAHAPLTYRAVNPKTLAITTIDAPGPAAHLSPSATAPDGKHAVECADDGSTIAVIELPSGKKRTFQVHEDDQREIARSCVGWAGSRYLSYSASVRGFLDTQTMKLSSAFLPADPERLVEYDRDLRYAVEPGKPSRVGRVVLPKP